MYSQSELYLLICLFKFLINIVAFLTSVTTR